MLGTHPSGDRPSRECELTAPEGPPRAILLQRGDRAYIGRKPSFTREQFVKVRAMLGQQAVGIAQIARETGLTRQTVYRIKGDPAGAEGALGVWGL